MEQLTDQRKPGSGQILVLLVNDDDDELRHELSTGGYEPLQELCFQRVSLLRVRKAFRRMRMLTVLFLASFSATASAPLSCPSSSSATSTEHMLP